MSHHEDAVSNTSSNPHIDQVIEERLANPGRRGLLAAGAGWASLSFIGAGAGLVSGCGGSDAAAAPTATAPAEVKASRPAALGFSAVAKSVADTLTVPAGYTASVLYRLGDPISAATSAYKNDGSDAAASFASRAGDHHDGMHFFGLDASGKLPSAAGEKSAQAAAVNDRGLLAINHEAITPMFLHPNGVSTSGTGSAAVRTSADEVQREFYVHGVSVAEVARGANGGWSIKQDSSYNRRIHTLTEMQLSGPAAGSPMMVTKYSTSGTRTRGTVNNCASGYTPWGTYLTCEENWAGYFRRVTATDNPKRNSKELASFARYGVAGNGRELWATVTPDTADDLYGRWNAEVRGATAAEDYRNGPNTYGWNVEVDPYSASSAPKKRTAMGRFAHEGAWPAKAVAGKPLVW